MKPRCQLTLISVTMSLICMVSARADGPPFDGATSYRQTVVHVTYGIHGVNYEYSSGYDPDGANEPVQGILRSSVVASSQSSVFIPGGIGVEQVDAIRIPISPPWSGWYSVRVTTLVQGDAFSVGNSVLLPGNADGSFVIWTGALILDGGVRRGWGDSETLCHTELDSPWDIVADGVMGLLLDLAGLGTVGDFVSLMNTLHGATDPVCHTALGSQFVFEPGGAYLEGGQTYDLEIVTHAFASSLSVAAAWGAHVGASDYVIQVTDWELVSQPDPPGLPTVGALSASPNPVAQGHLTTFIASDVVDPDGGVIVAVEFYRDANADGEITVTVDELLGQASWSGAQWQLTRAASWPVGIHAILARATTDVGQGVWGPVTTLELLVQPSFPTVTAGAGADGSISPSGTVSVPEGGDVTFMAYPDGGYEVNQWWLDANPVQSGGIIYTLYDVQANHTLLVTFRLSGPDSEITVLSPNGGEMYCQGDWVRINWESTGDCGDVRLELYKGGTFNRVIDDSAYNDGSMSWNMDSDVPMGTDYSVCITCLSSGASDCSDGYFEIIDDGDPRCDGGSIYIHDVNELQAICSGGLYPRDGYYVLANDIDAYETDTWNGGLGFQPIGDGSSTYFRGVLDGQGYKITGLWIERLDQDEVGLFSVVMNSAIVRNVMLDGTTSGGTIRGRGSVGALVGMCAGTVVNCHSSLEVRLAQSTARNTVGGLIGDNAGIVRNCSVSAEDDIRGYGNEVGGLVGFNSGIIEWSSAECRRIYGDSEVGGIVGTNWNTGTIRECSSAVWNQVDGDHYVGGVVGYNYGTITDSYSTAPVDANVTAGGIVGVNEGTVERCYAAGGIGTNNDAGGLVGRHYEALVGSFWDTQATGQGVSEAIGSGSGSITGCYGKTTLEMKQQATFTTMHGADWDFENTWTIVEGVAPPELRGIGPTLSPPTGVTASEGEPEGVHILWNEVVDAGAYRVYRADSQEGIPSPVCDWGSGLMFIDETAVPQQMYYYWVKAAATASGARESAFSNSASGWRDSPPLDSPGGVNATDGLPGFVLVEWEPVAGASYHHVYRSDSAAGPKTPLGAWQTDQSFVDNSGSPDTVYYYWVTAATNDQGERESDFGGPDTGYFLQPCNQDADCNNGLYCDGIEMCQAGVCVDGPAPCIDLAHCDEENDVCICTDHSECDDGLTCTTDTCDQDGHCEYDVAIGYCVISGACHLAGETNPANECEGCEPSLDANGWSPKVAGTACGDPADTECDHADTCDGAGTCQDNLEPDGTICPDGEFCNGTETCQAGVCIDGPDSCVDLAHCDEANDVCICLDDSECNDGVDCTIDTCDGDGTCVHTPDDSACNDGQFCNGTETCDAIGDCQIGTPPCASDETCDEEADECAADCNSNDVPDDEDLAIGTSEDCNGNGMPDECEVDTDRDGMIDLCDVCPNTPEGKEVDESGCSCSQLDDTAPEIMNCPETLTIALDVNCQFTAPEFSSEIEVSDDCTPADELVFTTDPDFLGSLVLSDNQVIVYVTDESGNSTSCTVTVTIEAGDCPEPGPGPTPDCGDGLCATGAGGALPFTVLGIFAMKSRIRRRSKQRRGV